MNWCRRKQLATKYGMGCMILGGFYLSELSCLCRFKCRRDTERCCQNTVSYSKRDPFIGNSRNETGGAWRGHGRGGNDSDNAEETHGRIFITKITSGGPAEKAVKSGDIVLMVNGKEVKGLADCYRSFQPLNYLFQRPCIF